MQEIICSVPLKLCNVLVGKEIWYLFQISIVLNPVYIMYMPSIIGLYRNLLGPVPKKSLKSPEIEESPNWSIFVAILGPDKLVQDPSDSNLY